MRTLVDIPEKQIKALDKISQRRKSSRAAIIREAIDSFVKSERDTSKDDAFGLWSDRKIDGLEYQRKLRSEW